MSSSNKYFAFLRGINVGRHIIKMEALRDLFYELGYQNIQTYIQSGNVFFESRDTEKLELRNNIEKHLAESLNYEVAVSLRTINEVENIIQQNPFSDIEIADDKRFAVTLLPAPVKIVTSLPYTTKDGGYELISMNATELFVVWHLKNGRPSNSYGQLEKIVGGHGTTRFWHTLIKIHASLLR